MKMTDGSALPSVFVIRVREVFPFCEKIVFGV
jgi:hypothetical protein